MKYTLITSNGKVLTFFIKTVAEQFQQAYGGVDFTQQVLELEMVDQYIPMCYNIHINKQ